MRHKLNIRASQVAGFTQCSPGYLFTQRLEMLTFLSLIAAIFYTPTIVRAQR